MSYWYCPNCHAGLYWRSHQVRFGHPKGQGQCPFCSTHLSVRTPRFFWLLAFVGWLAYFVVTVVDRQLLSNLAAQYLALVLEPRTIELVSLALQLPLLLGGPRFTVLPPQR